MSDEADSTYNHTTVVTTKLEHETTSTSTQSTVLHISLPVTRYQTEPPETLASPRPSAGRPCPFGPHLLELALGQQQRVDERVAEHAARVEALLPSGRQRVLDGGRTRDRWHCR